MTPIIDPLAAIILASSPSSESYSALPWSPVIEEPAATRHLVGLRRTLAAVLATAAARVQPNEQQSSPRWVATSR